MSVVLTSTAIYDLFYDDYEMGKSFLHSHTHSGNALAAAVALECFKVIQDENIYSQVKKNETVLVSLMQEVSEKTKKLNPIRHIGNIVAADLKLDAQKKNQRMGYEMYKKALGQGVLLRPLGNTLYWLPPLNIKTKDLYKLRDMTIAAVNEVFL